MTAPLPGIVRPSLIELAVDLLQDQIRDQFNVFLQAQVAVQYRNDGRKIVLEKLIPNNVYIGEGVKPLKCPAVFIIADRSDHEMTAQNVAIQNHTILVAVLVEDIQAETSRITRKAWRYGRAMWDCLHDRNLGGPVESQSIHVFAESLTYSPIISATSDTGDRKFRKDATLRLRVRAYENLFT